MIGQTVSHYRIVDKLGQGAMGVVYLAEDTHLGRHVALKFLSDSQDPHYRARFLREARAVSTLSHPHIAVVHDYGETPEGQPFIVMEYIKGQNLSDLLHSSAVTIAQAVEVIEAVAQALASAHARGIIHRDIKPSNVIVDKEGAVKVLDFGLVKQLHEEHPPSGPDANTLLARTSSNIIIGTPLYLSPEQATGADVDARSDLFALGAMLYECLTGKPAFSGGSVIEIGAQILHFNPPPPSSINPRVHPELDRITLKALAKRPESRYQSAAEMVVDLKATRKVLDNEDGHRTQRLIASKPSHSSAFKSISDSLRRPRLSIGFFALALILVVTAVWYILTSGPDQARVPFQNMPVTKVTNTGKSLTAEISPDGKYIAHALDDAGQQSLVLTYLATASNVTIAPPAAVRYQAITFSNDGNYIYFVRHEKTETGLLYQVPALSGTSRKILSNVDSKITFAPDGKRFAFVRFDKSKGEYSLMIAQSNGAGERRLATRSNPDLFSIYGLAWSPDGKVIACLDGTFTGGFRMRVMEVRVSDGIQKPITSRNWFGLTRVVWLKDGSGLLVTAAEESVSPIQIWHVSYPGGEARRVTNDSNHYRDLSLTADSKVLVSIQYSRLVNMWIAPNGEADRATQITSGVGWTYGLAWISNDRIVYSTMASGKLDLWNMDSNGGNKTQLTNDAGSNYHPAVSADGRYIFFSSSRTGPFNIWRMNTDGNDPKQLTDGASDIHPYPTRDGQWVVFQRGGGGGGKPTLWKVPVDGGRALQLTDANLSVPVVSPDDKTIACRYLDESTNTQKIAIISADGGLPLRVFNIPIHQWQRIRWTDNGSSLTYVDVRSGIGNIWSQPLDGGSPHKLTHFRADQIFSYDWARDGKLACERGVETTDVVLINDYK